MIMEHYWPPGFRFYPTEEELVSFYLHKKREGKPEHLNRLMDRVIPVLDLYEYNPWDLPQFSCYKDPEQWFFFVPRQEHEARRGRPRRLTTNGYWKATGSPGFVYSSKTGRPIGGKRTMVFYNGRAPNGKKTEWKMNEYKAIEAPDQQSSSSSSTAALLMLRKELSLCRVYKKSKCLRSFDRRPAAGVILRDPVPQPALINHVNDHPATIPPLRASSANSSSGGNPSQSGETIDIFMGIDDEWDWDKMLDMCE